MTQRWQPLELRQAAFEEKKAPFYQKGQRKLDFTKINFKRISIEDLGSLDHWNELSPVVILITIRPHQEESTKRVGQTTCRNVLLFRQALR